MILPTNMEIDRLKVKVNTLEEIIRSVNDASVESIQGIAKLLQAALGSLDARITALEAMNNPTVRSSTDGVEL